jgi:hypothetical protein
VLPISVATRNFLFIVLSYSRIYKFFSQWKIISITFMDVDFWLVKCSGCENSHATEVKCSSISQKKLNFVRKSCKRSCQSRRKAKFSSPAFIFFPAETIPLSKFYTVKIQMSLQVFSANFLTSFHENGSRKITWIFATLTWFRICFCMKFYIPNMWTY